MSKLADILTEKELLKLEGKIGREYKAAWKEVKKKASDYMKSFEAKDLAQRALVESGQITEEQYKLWRIQALGQGQRWEQLRDNLAIRMTNANQVAMSYVNDTTPSIFSLNHNAEAYVIESYAKDISFTLYDENTVKRLIMENRQLLPHPRVDIPKDLKWNQKKIQSALTSGIIQGKKVQDIARSFQTVATMDWNQAIRSARTAVTGAQNAGRQECYEKAVDMGIQLEKEWIATVDNRTRDSHAELDGVRVPYDEEFPNGLMYPADPSGEPEEVYNCRCTMRAILPEINDEDRTGNDVEHYEKWLQYKETFKEV